MPGEPIGIVAGGGALPPRLAAAARAAGRPVSVIVLDGFGQPGDFAEYPSLTARLGAAGAMLDWLRGQGVRQVVLCGTVKRPSFLSLRPDAGAARIIARIGRAALGGDDNMLSALIRAVEAEGFAVVPSQAILHDLLPGAGPLGAVAADAAALVDIARGIAVQRLLGQADVGQGVVVQQGLVLAVEAIEGTDAMLARVGPLHRDGPGGVLVKLLKPGQSRLIDLPTIGLPTVRNAAAAGLRGIAIEAGGTIVVDRAAVVAEADAAGLFLLAIHPDHHVSPATTQGSTR